jgi:hypothetical protein
MEGLMGFVFNEAQARSGRLDGIRGGSLHRSQWSLPPWPGSVLGADSFLIGDRGKNMNGVQREESESVKKRS